MRDVIDQLEGFWQRGTPFGLATVVATWKSSPRQPGATMAVADGAVAIELRVPRAEPGQPGERHRHEVEYCSDTARATPARRWP